MLSYEAAKAGLLVSIGERVWEAGDGVAEHNHARTSRAHAAAVGGRGFCSLDAADSSATLVDRNLIIEFEITFHPPFEGEHFAVALANDGTATAQSVIGLVEVGQPPPTAVSVTPNGGPILSGVPATFTAAFRDVNGGATIDQAFVVFHRGTLANSCTVLWVPGTLVLLNDAASSLLPAGPPGSGGTASNSQCTLDAAASSVLISGRDVIIEVVVTFSPSYAGGAGIAAVARDPVASFGNVLSAGSITVQ